MRRRALLAAGLVAAAGAPLACRKRRPAPRFPGLTLDNGGLYYVYEIDFARAWEPERSREAVVARTVEVLRRRMAALTELGVVRPRASGADVEVFLPGGPAKRYEAKLYESFRRIAEMPGRFQVALVDDGSSFMAALAQRVRDESPGGVDVQEDRWMELDSEAMHTDLYLLARNRQRLLDVLTRDAVRNAIPSDRAILLEKFHAGEGEGERWRTYYVQKTGGIANTDIAEAHLGASRDGRPDLEIILTSAGRKAFDVMTTNGVGRKIAVVIDGQIESAPVVRSRIPGGRVHILTSRNPSLDLVALVEEVEDLAAALNSGPLPAPLRLMIQDMFLEIPAEGATPRFFRGGSGERR